MWNNDKNSKWPNEQWALREKVSERDGTNRRDWALFNSICENTYRHTIGNKLKQVELIHKLL